MLHRFAVVLTLFVTLTIPFPSEIQAKPLFKPRVTAQRIFKAIPKIRGWFPKLFNRAKNGFKDWKAIRRAKGNGSIETYIDHHETLGTGVTFVMNVNRAKNGAEKKITPRKVAEVTTTKKGLRRYINHVGANTVELVFNPRGEYGHMLIRAGRKLYEFGNHRFARRDMDFAAKLNSWSGPVGQVYKVDPKMIPKIQKELAILAEATEKYNLPPFDSYGQPVRIQPREKGGFEILTKSTNALRAHGKIDAKLVEIDGKEFLEAPNGARVPVLSHKGDVLKIETLTCTSYPISTLARLLPGRGFEGFKSHSRNFARSAMTKNVRGNTPALPDLLTVYTPTKSNQTELQQTLWDIGKKTD